MRRQKKSPTERRGSPLWLIIFSDMSTNLMLFFLMLFAMTRMSEAERLMVVEGMEKAVDKTAKLERIEKKRQEKTAVRVLKDTIVYGKLKKYAKMDVDERKIKLTLELPVFFRIGSAELTPVALDTLKSLVTPLKAFPNDIIIEGHTDSIPITGGRYPSNWELSVARSVSVIDLLLENGLDPRKLVAGGYGEYHPLYDNETKEHRAKNRRIEITIIRQPGG
jgi:chemotaxis protein MotB